jgi:uncharacterized repeat protein (TIGR03803 family)
MGARLLALLSLLLSFFAGISVQGQTFTTIHTLTDAEGYFSSTFAGLLIQGSDGNFYGNIEFGGSHAVGSVFKITPAGIFTVIYSFGSVAGDGAYPTGGLVQGSDGNFYGMTGSTIFKITPSGALTTLYTNAGWDPNTLVLGKDGSFYGTMYSFFDNSLGNNGGSGRVFKVTTNGTAAGTTFTTLHIFSIMSGGANADGGNPSPHGSLVQSSDGNFYGTTFEGGPDGDGTIFKITPGGTLTTLYAFAFTPNQGAVNGRSPFAGLFQDSSGVFYGTTEGGGPGAGTAFQFTTDGSPAGTKLTTLYNFLADQDGAVPDSTLAIDSDGNIYGMTDLDGSFSSNDTDNQGTLFRLALDGTITTLHSFGAEPGEGIPHVGVVQGSDGSFYGTTKSTIFKFDPGNGAPLPPPHGGLSATVFKVNGRKSPTAGVADTILSFTALQTGTPAGLMVRVQASTTPTTESSWTDLPNGTGGSMVYDVSSLQFVLTSSSYPLSGGVSFRAISSAPAYPDSISNVVGPFNLTSTKAQIGSTSLNFTGNGTIADLYFRATESATVAGMSVRVQASTTPGDEASWSDLSNGTMTQSTDPKNPKQFLLLVNNYPTTQGVCFRAIASASGYADSISNIMGPFDITGAVVPPVVTVTTANPLSGSGDGHDSGHPIIVAVDSGAFAATVQSARALKTVQLQVDGATVTEYPGSSDPNAVYIAYFTPTVGDHVYEAAAINDLLARARAGSGAIYVRVIPSQSTAKAMRAPGSGFDTKAAGTGQVYTAANDGNWNDPNTWTNNANGSLGVPGPNDFAIINSHTIIVDSQVGDAEVGSLTINGGAISTLPNGTGLLKVDQDMTIVSGRIDRVDLAIPSTCQVTMLNDADFPFYGTVSIPEAGQFTELAAWWVCIHS